MSFRSRSHTKPVAPPRRRSSSLTRNVGSSNGYQSSANSRPFSVHGSAMNFPSSHLYGSNQNLRMGGGAGDYYANGGSEYRRSSYTSPYKDRYPQSYYANGANGGGYTSAYKDRSYFSPYTSYDNGVTTASLSIPSSSSGMRREYTPMRSNLLSTSTSVLGGSNSNLNSQSINDKVANIGRSQSLREHERKNRSRKAKEAAKAAVPDMPYDASGMNSLLSSANKSLSSLSLQSEGYESGNESRSRAESLASNALGDANDDDGFIDYKALYEAAKAENERLRGSLKSKEQDLAAAKSALERLTAAAAKSSLSENEKREKRAMERKISEMEEELKQLHKYKHENERLRAENRALTRVVSKLTTSAQNQLLNKQ